MIIRFTHFILFLFFYLTVLAQPTIEQTIFTSDGVSEFSAETVIQSSDDGFVIAGTRNQYHPEGFPIEGGWYWMMIAKTDAAGDTLWQKEFPDIRGRNFHLTELADQSIVVVYNSDGGLFCDGIFISFPPYANLSMMKLDASGNVLQDLPFMVDCSQSIIDLKWVSDGFIVFINEDHTIAADVALLRKYDFDGVQQWEHAYNYLDLFASFELISETEYFLMGRTFNVPDVDNNLLKLVKTDNTGAILGEIVVDTLLYNNRFKMVKSTDGNFVLASRYTLHEYFTLTKIDEAGNILWRKNHLADFKDIVPTSDNGFLLLKHDVPNVLVSKVNETGNVLWTQSFSLSGENDTPNGITETTDGEWAAVGTFACCDGESSPAGWFLVKNGDEESAVWPGDANSDGFVDMDDLLAMGLAYGTSGSIRPGATLTWNAEPSADWGTNFTDAQFNGINHKHADCDGNGLVEEADTVAISWNYGFTHAKGEGEESEHGIPLFWEVSDTIIAGIEHTFSIHLGNADTLAENIYGLRFTAHFSLAPDVPDTLTLNAPFVNYSGSWLGIKHVDMLTLDTAFTESLHWDVALSRNDLISETGFGEICQLVCVMDVGSLKTGEDIELPLVFSFGNIKVIQQDGSEVEVTPVSGAAILKSTATTTPNLAQTTSEFEIYPNPATQIAIVKVPSEMGRDVTLTVYNSAGIKTYEAAVNTQNGNSVSLDLNNWKPGVYLILLSSGSMMEYGKLIVTR